MLTFTSVAQTCGTGKASQKIESFEIVTLRLSGMRFTTEYEIVMKGKDAEVVEYAIRYNKNEDKRVPERQTVCSADKILKLLKDGIMFSLQATVNGDRKIRAEGSENFPKHFRELRDGLHAILSQK